MLPTPDTSHVSFDNVYEPAEDSFLLLDTLASSHEIAFLTARFGSGQDAVDRSSGKQTPSPLVLEVGPGSGVILAFVAVNAHRLLGRQDILTIGIDVNEFACKATARTVATNMGGIDERFAGIFLDSVNASLTACVRPYTVDLLIFNPPYVPSEELPIIPSPADVGQRVHDKTAAFERDNKLLALATDGGADGMETTWPLLDQLPTILSGRGVAYVLLCAQNRPETVKARLEDWNHIDGRGKWDVQMVGSSGKTGGWEKLQIIRISRSLHSSSLVRS